MEKVLVEMLAKLKSCAKADAGAHLGEAMEHLDAALVWAKAPQGLDAEGGAFWSVVNDQMFHIREGLRGNEESLRWLVENCPVDFSAVGSDSTKTFADQARARLMKLKEPQKVSG